METRVNTMDRRRLTTKAVAESIFRYEKRFFGTFAVILFSVLLYAFVSPRQYQSEMNIVVPHARPGYQIALANGSSSQPDGTEEKANAEIEVLRSRDVADRVVDPQWNSSTQQDKTSSQIKNHEKEVETFAKHLKIELINKSNVIHVSYEASSAIEATKTLNQLLQIFLAKQQELDHPSNKSSFFAGEQERYKHELDIARQEMASYQQSRQIVSLPDKEAALERQISELQQQLRTTDVQISDLSDRLASGQRELQTLSQRQATQQKTLPNILAMEQLGTMLAGYRNQKTALLTKFPPTDRLVQEVDQQIVNTSEALRTASETQPSEKTTDVNPIWQQIKSSVSQNAMDRSAAIARQRNLSTQLANLQAELVKTEDSTVDFNTLQAKVTEIQGNYQFYTQKRNEMQMENAMDQQQLANIAIAERPTFSAIPSDPKLIVVLPLGIFTSIFMALCVVFFSEMARDTIVSPWELEAIVLAPVLATIPFIEDDYLRFKDASIPTQTVASSNKSIQAGSLVDTIQTLLAARFRSNGMKDFFARLSSLIPNNKGSSTISSSPLTMSKVFSP